MDANYYYYKRYEPFWGSWYITQKLGEGSYGTVFEIESMRGGMRRRAALKIITVPKTDAELKEKITATGSLAGARHYYTTLANKLQHEIELMAALRGCENIVNYEKHKVITHSNGIGRDIFMRMELLIPLDKYRKTYGMSREDVIKLGIDTCLALEVCESQNIIHRDIKPANLFISGSGSYKLGDFGIARIASESTGASTVIGTKRYMAPEILRYEKYGRSVDVYSLGIVMYQLLNDDRLPFMPTNLMYRDEDRAFNMRMRGEEMPLPIRAQDELGRVVLKACAFRPQDRYASASELKWALQRLLRQSNHSGYWGSLF